MINSDPLWHVSAIKLWANWSSFNKINGHMVPSILLVLSFMHMKKSRNYHFKLAPDSTILPQLSAQILIG